MYAPMPAVGLDEPSYSVGEAAAMFGVVDATVRRWLKVGLIAHIRTPSGRARIPESALAGSVTIHPVATPTSQLATV